MIKGSTIILLFYLAGVLLSRLIGGFIPGSVCGMLLLFMALQLKVVKAQDVKAVAKGLTDNMAIFYVPVGVGIISATDMISNNLLTFIVVPVATTAIVIVVVGVIQQRFERKFTNDKEV